MSVSNDPGHFFQTDASAAKAERRAAKRGNKNGDPIDLGSKLLAIILDPLNPDRVYVAESGGLARRISLEVCKNDAAPAATTAVANPHPQTGDNPSIYRGHTAPVTSLALDSTAKTLFAGSWDKTIISWDTNTRKPLQTFTGHTDFVKSLLYLLTSDSNGLLLSGSSDASIIIWNATTGARIYALSGHNRGIGTLALDPVTSTLATAVVYSGGSERDIKKWEIPVEEPRRSREVGEPMLEHETSINMIRFEGEDADMWTASADRTARRIDVRNEMMVDGGRSDTVLGHPDYVNDVVVEPTGRWAVTACRDEEVRVWDVGTGELYHVYDGHSEDVMGLAIFGSKRDMVASVSIDGTIRKWSLKRVDLLKAIEAKREENKEKEGPIVEEKTGGLLTVEEERELAELMEDDD